MSRTEPAATGVGTEDITLRLTSAKDLHRQVLERLRNAIWALHHTSDEPSGPLPVMLERLSAAHQTTDLEVRVRVEGSHVPLPPQAEQPLLRLAGEALFNSAPQGKADRRADPQPEKATFTERELRVLELLAAGLSNRVIGAELFISETTVKFHVRNIMRKLEPAAVRKRCTGRARWASSEHSGDGGCG